MSFLKPTYKPVSSNINNDLVKGIYTPQAQQGAQGTNYLTSLLTGQGDVGAAQGGYDQYLQNAGYDNALKRMSQEVVGGGAASGLLRSGATAKALQSRGAEINQGYFNNYLSSLSGLSNLGLQSGQLLTSAGSATNPKQPSTGGIIAGIGGKLLGSIFSDYRLKEDVQQIGEMSDGLGIYTYRYLNGEKQFVGVMADEVAVLRPWALGPVVAGFQTVNYGSL
jgi:hypothetical protein